MYNINYREVKNMKKKIAYYKINKNLEHSDIFKLRGYFAHRFKDPIFHNHTEVLKHCYSLIQYKIINDNFAIVGIEEGAEKLKDVFDTIKYIKIDQNYYKIQSSKLIECDEYFHIDNSKTYTYRFISPWVCIGNNNIERFKRKELNLNTLLTNNIFCTMKFLDLDTKSNIIVSSKIKKTSVNFKNKIFYAFLGWFKTNVKIPNYIGLGKIVSTGHGTVQRMVNYA